MCSITSMPSLPEREQRGAAISVQDAAMSHLASHAARQGSPSPLVADPRVHAAPLPQTLGTRTISAVSWSRDTLRKGIPNSSPVELHTDTGNLELCSRSFPGTCTSFPSESPHVEADLWKKQKRTGSPSFASSRHAQTAGSGNCCKIC